MKDMKRVKRRSGRESTRLFLFFLRFLKENCISSSSLINHNVNHFTNLSHDFPKEIPFHGRQQINIQARNRDKNLFEA